MNVEYISFTSREVRANYLSKRFSAFFQGSLLDVGCYKGLLKNHLPDAEYTGVDINEAADIVLNLEQAERLPFEDAQFDTVICIDVLEHLDNLHALFDELFRVAKKNVIVSLPNCWGGARRPLEKGKGNAAHYGLPVERPVDRHKWFFSFSDAMEFYEKSVAKKPFKIIDRFATEKPRNPLVSNLRKLKYSDSMSYLNRYSNTAWVVCERE